MANTIQLTAIQCPAIQTVVNLLLKSAAYASPGTIVPIGQTIVPGDGSTLVPKFDSNALSTDLTGAYGGTNGYAIARGLTLSAPASGLLLNVAAGHAMIGGVVEVPAATTVMCTDNLNLNWIWLLQNGTLTATTTLTAPSTESCLIGNCTTVGGNIVNVDTSGVLFLKGGNLWRQTADAGAPIDAPPTTIQFTAVTLGGTYWWDGAFYQRLGPQSTAVSDALTVMASQVELLSLTLAGLISQLVELGLDEILTDELVSEVYEQA